MKLVLTGLMVYLALVLLGCLKVWAERPPTCPKGHTDHYCLNGWHCRTCTIASFERGLRKLARERIP